MKKLPDKDKDKEELSNIYFNDETQEEIFNLFRRVSENTGTEYMLYLYENFDKKVRYAFTTNPDWGKHYVGDNKIDNCHLWLNVTKYFLSTDMKTYVLPWNTIKPETQKQRSICFDRTDHGIGINGVSFCSRFENNREFLALAPDLKTPKFQLYVSKNIDVVKNAAAQIRKKLEGKIFDKRVENIFSNSKNK